ncbi:D-alanine--D-alanine ligase [Quadrisphaera granulorum]|uniref:D-alanine--D-alanine ligase n=1 Tax=Quadrisphaera granulorum TaxID=317664 RepID=A0A316AF06_9ACTN|nr:D-alanine--D-alanine ligase family protein [Quadrisphaera granulorum]PWJ56365.1 D-alanine--D-alanine ligase [Quadrisphaera granulorum]SZE94999.1 D-alanine--D-alanine ligase [Quadrisphaera granulorum]
MAEPRTEPHTEPQSERPRVAVVFGGRSSEHAISCATAAGVLAALDRSQWDVVPVGVTPSGHWVLVDDDPARWSIREGAPLPEVGAVDGPGVLVPLATDDRALRVSEPGAPPRELGNVDVVLPLLHGPYGEDGTLQGLLELGDVRYVGSGVLASALSMDKGFTRTVLAAAGLPVGPWVTLLPGQWEADRETCEQRVAALGWPVFVKPARAGSSMGVSKVSAPGELAAAVELAACHDPKVVVEAAVPSPREVEVGVLQELVDLPGGGVHAVPRASVVGEIVVGAGRDFYDFEAKYLDDDAVRLDSPADLPADVADRARALALEVFTAVGAEGLARVDLFLTADGELLVNEVNTMPGFTASSMFPRLWAATGLAYPQLLDRLLRLALARRTGLR